MSKNSTEAPQPSFHTTKNILKRSLIGKNLKCRQCRSKQAYISLEEKRYMVNCPVCGNHYHLKLQYE